jgi:hypothetical protein
MGLCHIYNLSRGGTVCDDFLFCDDFLLRRTRSKVWRIQGIYAISSKFGKFPVNIRVASLEKPIRRPGYRARAP